MRSPYIQKEYKPLLHKKGKRWIVVGLSSLALLAMGTMPNLTTHADANTNHAPSTTNVSIQKPEIKQVHSQDTANQAVRATTSTDATSKNSASSNNDYLNQINNSAVKVHHKLEQSSQATNTLKLGTPNQQGRAFGYVEHGIKKDANSTNQSNSHQTNNGDAKLLNPNLFSGKVINSTPSYKIYSDGAVEFNGYKLPKNPNNIKYAKLNGDAINKHNNKGISDILAGYALANESINSNNLQVVDLSNIGQHGVDLSHCPNLKVIKMGAGTIASDIHPYYKVTLPNLRRNSSVQSVMDQIIMDMPSKFQDANFGILQDYFDGQTREWTPDNVDVYPETIPQLLQNELNAVPQKYKKYMNASNFKIQSNTPTKWYLKDTNDNYTTLTPTNLFDGNPHTEGTYLSTPNISTISRDGLTYPDTNHWIAGLALRQMPKPNDDKTALMPTGKYYSDNAISDWQNGNDTYYGLTYRYDLKNNTIEFTDGKYIPENINNNPFISDYNSNMPRVLNKIVNDRGVTNGSVKFDSDVDMSNMNKSYVDPIQNLNVSVFKAPTGNLSSLLNYDMVQTLILPNGQISSDVSIGNGTVPSTIVNPIANRKLHLTIYNEKTSKVNNNTVPYYLETGQEDQQGRPYTLTMPVDFTNTPKGILTTIKNPAPKVVPHKVTPNKNNKQITPDNSASTSQNKSNNLFNIKTIHNPVIPNDIISINVNNQATRFPANSGNNSRENNQNISSNNNGNSISNLTNGTGTNQININNKKTELRHKGHVNKDTKISPSVKSEIVNINVKHPLKKYVYAPTNTVLYGRRKNIRISKNRGFTGKVIKATKRNGKKAYVIRWHHKNFVVNAREVSNAYIQPHDVKKYTHGIIKHFTVKLKKNARLYNSIHFTNQHVLGDIRKGSKFTVVGIKRFGEKGYKRTRLVSSNGWIITANKNFVSIAK